MINLAQEQQQQVKVEEQQVKVEEQQVKVEEQQVKVEEQQVKVEISSNTSNPSIPLGKKILKLCGLLVQTFLVVTALMYWKDFMVTNVISPSTTKVAVLEASTHSRFAELKDMLNQTNITVRKVQADQNALVNRTEALGTFLANRTDSLANRTDVAINDLYQRSAQVFSIRRGTEYSISRANAASVCREYGARLASYNELSLALQEGADWCATGWVSDRTDAYYPIQVPRSGCSTGTSAKITLYTPSVALADVNCFGLKPATPKSGDIIRRFNEFIGLYFR